MAQPQLPSRPCSCVQQPEQRLAQHGEPAVVLDQLQPRRQRSELVFFLRAGKQGGLVHLGGAGCDLAHRQHHRDGVLVVAHLGSAEFARAHGWHQPRRGKVVLHHGHPAVVSGLVVAIAALGDVLEVELLELAGLGVHGRASEGEVEAALAFWRVAVARQLQVKLRRECRAALVDELVLHAHGVLTALEGVGFDQLVAVDHGRLEAHHQLFGTRRKCALTWLERHGGQVVGQHHPRLAGDETGLRHVQTLGALIEQHHVVLRVQRIAKGQQFQPHQRTTLAVQGGLDQVSCDGDLFTREHGRGCRQGRSRGHGCGRTRHGSWGRHTGSRHAGRSSTGRRSGSGVGPPGQAGQYGRLAAVLVPCLPQHEERHQEDHPEQGAANIGHGRFRVWDLFSAAAGWRRPSRVNRPAAGFGKCSGTGSQPPLHQGWQRRMRQPVSAVPPSAPWRCSACNA